MNTIALASRCITLAVIGLIMPLASLPARAQGGGGIVGGGGGGSTPGMISPPVTHSSESSSSWGGRSAPLNLLFASSVQSELHLDAPQLAAIAEARAEVEKRQLGSFDDFRRLGDARAEVYRKLHEETEAQNRSADAIGDEILAVLTPRQKALVEQAQARDKSAVQANAGSGTGGGGVSLSPPPAGAGRVLSSNVVVRSGGSHSSSGGPSGSVVRALQNPRLLASLALSPQQEATVLDALDRHRASEREHSQLVARRFAEARSKSPRAAMEADAFAGLTEPILALLSPAQRRRLDELSLQADGPDALIRPEVANGLKLTATQQAKLAAIRSASRPQANAAMRPGSPPDPSLEQRSRRDAERRMLTEVLTPAQRQTFEKMKGRPFAGLDQLPAMGGGSRVASGGGTIFVR